MSVDKQLQKRATVVVIHLHVNEIVSDKERECWYEDLLIQKQEMVKLDSGARCNVIFKQAVEGIGAQVKNSKTKRLLALEIINLTY